jgi:hypothetical protein
LAGGWLFGVWLHQTKPTQSPAKSPLQIGACLSNIRLISDFEFIFVPGVLKFC